MIPAPVQISIKKENSMKIDFAYNFRPVYYFSRVYGLMPFTITYNSCGTINGLKIKIFDILWFIVLLTINSLLTFVYSIDTLYLKNPKILSNTLVGGDYFLEVCSMTFNFILIGMDMCMRFKLVDILKRITIFDEDVSESVHIFLIHSLFKNLFEGPRLIASFT